MSIDSLTPDRDELIVDCMDRDFLEDNKLISMMTLDMIDGDKA